MKHPYLDLLHDLRAAVPVFRQYLQLRTGVGGGMHPKAAALWSYLLAVQKSCRVQGDLVEIGVFQGWGSYLPAHALAPREKLVLVDIAAHYLEAARNFVTSQTPVTAENIVQVQVDSAAGNFSNTIDKHTSRARWIHIDGEHSYPAVIRDLDTAARVATSDAIIVVDDVDHALAPCINDALLDWLRGNQGWRLLIRGYNKAYLVSTRAKINWREFVEIVPEVFDREFELKTVLASQTSSADTSYLSYGEGFNDAKYLRVNHTSTSLEDFEGQDPRTFFVGVQRRPTVLLFGNCQMQVLHHALNAAFDACGMNLQSCYVADVHELTAEGADQLRALAASSLMLITQVVRNERFAVGSEELEGIAGPGACLRVPSMHFNAYWPNQGDLRTQPDSDMAGPADAIAYLMLQAGHAPEAINSLLLDPGLYAPEELQQWVAAATTRLRERERYHKLDVSLSDIVAAADFGERPFYTFNHPRKVILDRVTARVLALLAQRFAPRDRAAYERLVSGQLRVSYDMSSIDFLDFPALPSVARGMGIAEDGAHAGVYRYFRTRGSGAVHRPLSLAAEIAGLAARMAKLSEEQHRFNAEQIRSTVLVPQRVMALLPQAQPSA